MVSEFIQDPFDTLQWSHLGHAPGGVFISGGQSSLYKPLCVCWSVEKNGMRIGYQIVGHPLIHLGFL